MQKPKETTDAMNTQNESLSPELLASLLSLQKSINPNYLLEKERTVAEIMALMESNAKLRIFLETSASNFSQITPEKKNELEAILTENEKILSGCIEQIKKAKIDEIVVEYRDLSDSGIMDIDGLSEIIFRTYFNNSSTEESFEARLDDFKVNFSSFNENDFENELGIEQKVIDLKKLGVEFFKLKQELKTRGLEIKKFALISKETISSLKDLTHAQFQKIFEKIGLVQ